MVETMSLPAPHLGELRERLQTRRDRLRRQLDVLQVNLAEIERRLKILNEVWAWGLEDEEHIPGNVTGDTALLGMPLSEAARYLRKREPNLTKEQALQRLKDLGYPFGEAAPGRAWHFAWLNATRSLNGSLAEKGRSDEARSQNSEDSGSQADDRLPESSEGR